MSLTVMLFGEEALQRGGQADASHLPDDRRGHPSVPIADHGARGGLAGQPRSLPGGKGAVPVDDARVGDAEAVVELARRRVPDVEAYEPDAAVAERGVQRGQGRRLLLAEAAPGGPHVHHHQASSKVGRVQAVPVRRPVQGWGWRSASARRAPFRSHSGFMAPAAVTADKLRPSLVAAGQRASGPASRSAPATG